MYVMSVFKVERQCDVIFRGKMYVMRLCDVRSRGKCKSY